MRYKTIKQFALETGYSEKAVRHKIDSGLWQQNDIWIKAADGRLLIDTMSFERWVEKARVSGKSPQKASRSSLSMTAIDAESALHLTPPPLVLK